MPRRHQSLSATALLVEVRAGSNPGARPSRPSEHPSSESGAHPQEPTPGTFGPGQGVSFTLESNHPRPHTRVSLVAMILPTNDGFIALDNVRLPRGGRAATHYLPGYDAGTEGNSEIRQSGGGLDDAGFPIPPPLEATVGDGGSGISAGAEGFVTVHRGVLGDSDDAGGTSDIDSRVHRWKNPMARVTIQRQ